MKEHIIGTIIFWVIGAPIYLPGLLSRLGIYKNWYLVPFMPPFAWRGIIYMWPFSAFFVCAPFIALSPLSDHLYMRVWASIGIVGLIASVILGLWRPRWAKPTWQRRLEEQYDSNEIKFVFIPAWRKMDRKEWGQLIETEEGLEKLVRMARRHR